MLSINNTTKSIGQLTNDKIASWRQGAINNLMITVKNGQPTERQLWANGVLMVGPKDGHAGQFVPYTDAVNAWRGI